MLVVLGNACRDITYSLDRMPVAGETVNARNVSFDLGGKGLNQAIAAHRSGAQVKLYAPVGDDAVAEAVRSRLTEEKLTPDGLIVRSGPSDASIILVDEAGENIVVTDARLAEGLSADEIEKLLALDAGDGLLMQGNLTIETTRAAAMRAHRSGAKVILNPAPFNASFTDLAGLVDAVIVNAVEARRWAGHTDPKFAIEKLGAPTAIVTLGASGCLLRDGNNPAVSLPAPLTVATDTTGAGDTFAGVFAAEWLATGDATRSAKLALLAASEMVRHRGAASAIPSGEAIARLRAGMLEESRP